MKIKHAFRALSSILLIALPGSLPAFAQDKTHNHTLGSASDVWRVELRDLKHFQAMSAGDRDGVSELFKLVVTLEGGNGQFHTVEEVHPYIRVDGVRRDVNSQKVSTGDRVWINRTGAGAPDDPYHLWIHVKQRGGGDIDRPTLRFKIKTRSREYDCTGQMRCQRGDSGEIVYNASIQIPRVRSNRCIRENTYRVTGVNGSTLVMRPNSRSREVITARHENHDDGPHMAIQSGEICIASTSR